MEHTSILHTQFVVYTAILLTAFIIYIYTVYISSLHYTTLNTVSYRGKTVLYTAVLIIATSRSTTMIGLSPSDAIIVVASHDEEGVGGLGGEGQRHMMNTITTARRPRQQGRMTHSCGESPVSSLNAL